MASTLYLSIFSAISKDEKLLIRSRAIPSGINEADHQLALQNALVIAKIARLDFPHDWYDYDPGLHCLSLPDRSLKGVYWNWLMSTKAGCHQYSHRLVTLICTAQA